MRQLLNAGCGAHFHPAWTNLDLNNTAPGVLPHDLRKGLPFMDASFDAVYHSHVLEHLARDEAGRFLKECHRILHPGGIVRVVVPDLEKIARLYLKALEGALAGDARQAERYRWIVLELLDQMVRTESGGDMLKYWRQEKVPVEEFVIERVGQEYLKFRKTYQSAANVPVAPTPGDNDKVTQRQQFAQSGELHKWMYDRFSLAAALHDAGFIEVRTCAASESRIPEFHTYLLDQTIEGQVRKPDSLFMEASKPC